MEDNTENPMDKKIEDETTDFSSLSSLDKIPEGSDKYKSTLLILQSQMNDGNHDGRYDLFLNVINNSLKE